MRRARVGNMVKGGVGEWVYREEVGEDEVGDRAFQERRSEWLGCFGKSETLSGSRLTARGHTRHFTASITQRLSFPLVLSHPRSLLSTPIDYLNLSSTSIEADISPKWVPFLSTTPRSPKRPSPSSS